MKIFGLETTGSFTGDISGSITSTGSFGSLSLGESSHIHTLSIKGRSEGSTGIRVRHPSDDTLFEVKASEDDGRLRLFANNSRKIQLHANDVSYFNGGDVGIGTESPQKDLHLHQNNSNTLFEALTIRTNSAGEGLTLGINSTNDGFITSQVGTALRLAGDSQSYATGHLLIYSGSGNIEAVKGNISGSASSTGSFARGHFHSIGINDTAPDYALDVTAGGSDTEMVAAFRGAQGGTLFIENTATDEVTFRVGSGDFITFNEGNDERVRIDGDGNVGIGDTSPGASLVVVSSAGNTARFGTTTDGVNIGHGSGFGFIQGTDTEGSAFNHLRFRTASDYGMILTTGNLVGIGTMSPAHKLDVVGDVRVRGDLTAETLIISSSVTQLTTQFASGSTRFGDTQDDNHEITGSVNITGSMMISNKLSTSHTLLRLDNESNLASSDMFLDFTVANGATAISRIGSRYVGSNDVDLSFHTFNSSGLGERMRIDKDGNVGIGTSSPTTFSGFTTVHHKNPSGDTIMLGESDGGVISQIISSDSNSAVFFGARSNHALTFTTNDTRRITVDTSGNVGIGLTSPSSPLHIRTSTNENLEFEEASGNLRISALNDARSANVELQFAASQFHFLTGNVGIGNSSPPHPLTVTGVISGSGTGYFSNIILGGTEQIAVNNGNLYYTGGNLGIGTTSPDSFLHVSQSSTGNTAVAKFVRPEGSNATNYMVEILNADSTSNQGAGVNIQAGNDDGDTSLNVADRAGTSLFRVRSDGNVGIGNTSPVDLLHVGAGADSPDVDSVAIFTHTGTTNVAIRDASQDVELLNYAYSGGGLIGTVTNHDLGIRTNNTNRITILNGGNVGIGETSPSFPLDVVASANTGDPLTQPSAYQLAIRNSNGNTSAATSIAFGHETFDFSNFISSLRTSSGNHPTADLTFGSRPSDNTTFVEHMRIKSNGNVGIGNTGPTEKLAVTGNISGSGHLKMTGAITGSTVKTTSTKSLESPYYMQKADAYAITNGNSKTITIAGHAYGAFDLHTGGYGGGEHWNVHVSGGGLMTGGGGPHYSVTVLANQSTSNITVGLTSNNASYVIEITNNSGGTVYASYKFCGTQYTAGAQATVTIADG